MDFLRRTWAEISIPALLHNYNLIKAISGSCKILPVVKGNAYGHSAVDVANALKTEVDGFCVSNFNEATILRQNGIVLPILIFGYTPPECAKALAENNITQAVFSLDYAEQLSSCAGGKTVDVHIKLDTGMGRIGFKAKDDAIEEISKVYHFKNLNVTGIFTHFSTADSNDTYDIDYADKQYKRFKSTVSALKERGFNTGLVHCLNSAALLSADKYHSDACRPGIILYGLNPSSSVTLEGIQPVMTLKSVVSMVKTINKGDALSYGRNYIADREMRVATVSAGYADGFPRALSGKGEVIVNGKRAKILGNICMDQFIIDVTDIENVKGGDEVILFGEEITADEIAEICKTIGYEITCGISHRVPRVIKY